jgi:uncharacterized small protein (DUF1192 family)
MNPLMSMLKAADDEVEKIDKQLDILVEAYMKEFCGLRFDYDQNQNFEMVKRIKLRDGLIILKWHVYSRKGRNSGRKGGPYWYRCCFRKTGRSGKFYYKYIGTSINKNDLHPVYRNVNGEIDNDDRWRFLRDINSWDRIKFYSKAVDDLKARKKMLTGEIKRLKALIKAGRREITKKRRMRK